MVKLSLTKKQFIKNRDKAVFNPRNIVKSILRKWEYNGFFKSRPNKRGRYQE
jgi:hypothetical protein